MPPQTAVILWILIILALIVPAVAGMRTKRHCLGLGDRARLRRLNPYDVWASNACSGNSGSFLF